MLWPTTKSVINLGRHQFPLEHALTLLNHVTISRHCYSKSSSLMPTCESLVDLFRLLSYGPRIAHSLQRVEHDSLTSWEDPRECIIRTSRGKTLLPTE